jgi:hypothetical protein
MLLEQIAINKKLPFSSTYTSDIENAQFCRNSYEANGQEYIDSYAPGSEPLIVQNECESKEDYNRRKKQTPSRSYVSSVINKYTSSIFRNEPSRLGDDPSYLKLLDDADSYGANLNDVMKTALKYSQIDGVSYLIPDSTEPTGEILTLSQKLSSDAKSFIRLVKIEAVANIVLVENKITEALVIFEDELGNQFARYMDDYKFVDCTLGKEYKVTSIGEEVPHGYLQTPLIRLKPFDVAQALPMSYSQRTIVNILSLLHEELTGNVFSKWILSGCRVNDEPEQKITWSGKRMVVLESEQAKLQLLGSDHQAADSLRKEIELEEANLFKSAGLTQNNVEPTNVSGVSRLIAMEGFFVNCNYLKIAIEDAENALIKLIATRDDFEFNGVVYSSKWIVDDNGEQLLKLRDLLSLNLPNKFKKLAIIDYINTFYSVKAEDMDEIVKELEDANAPRIN